MTNDATDNPKLNDLRVWYIPQVPMPAFFYKVDSIEDGVKILDAICQFSNFEFENNVKPDFSAVGGISRWEEDGEGGFAWYDVDDDELEEVGMRLGIGV